MICAAEQAVIVHEDIYERVKSELTKRGLYFLSKDETEKIRKTIIIDGVLNANVVGQSAQKVASLAGVSVDPKIKILIGEIESTEPTGELAHEKLCPFLAMYKTSSFEGSLEKAYALI